LVAILVLFNMLLFNLVQGFVNANARLAAFEHLAPDEVLLGHRSEVLSQTLTLLFLLKLLLK